MKHMKRENAQKEMLEEHCVLEETWGKKCAGDGEGLRRFIYCPGCCSTRTPAADAGPGWLQVSAGKRPAGARGQGASSARRPSSAASRSASPGAGAGAAPGARRQAAYASKATSRSAHTCSARQAWSQASRS